MGKGLDWVVFFGSLIPPFVLGVLFTTLFRGMPIDADMNIHAHVSDYINVYSILGGVTVTLLCFQHGLMFITLRTIGDLQNRARKMAQKIMGVVL